MTKEFENIWIKGNRCSRCGYEWKPIDMTKKPRTCPNPKCKSPYWDRPIERESTSKAVKKIRKEESQGGKENGAQ
jgi:hypothetical protein